MLVCDDILGSDGSGSFTVRMNSLWVLRLLTSLTNCCATTTRRGWRLVRRWITRTSVSHSWSTDPFSDPHCIRRSRRRLSSSVTLCIVAKRYGLQQKLLGSAYRKSYMRTLFIHKNVLLAAEFFIFSRPY